MFQFLGNSLIKAGHWLTKSSKGERTLAGALPHWNAPTNFGTWGSNRTEQVRQFKGWPYIAIKSIMDEMAGKAPGVAYVKQTSDVDFAREKHARMCRRWCKSQREYQAELRGWDRKYIRGAKLRKAITNLETNQELEIASENHPLVKLLRNPNGPDVSSTFFAKLSMYSELSEASYIWVVDGKAGIPQELWVIPTQWVRPMPGTTKLIDHYEVRPHIAFDPGWWGIGGATAIRFEADELISFTNPSPLNMLGGQSPMAAMSEWIDSANAIDKSRWAQFENGAFPGIVIELDKEVQDPDPNVISRFKAEIKAKYQGVLKTGEPVVLGRGMRMVPATQSPTEMAYKDSADQLRDWQLAGWRVPRSIVGLVEEVTYSNMTAGTANFILRTIRPKRLMMGQILTEKLARRFGDDLIIYWEDDTPEDPAQKLAENVAYLTHGVKTINEMRADLGLEPYPHGGDDPNLPMGVSPIPFFTGEEPEEAPTTAVAAQRWDEGADSQGNHAAGKPGQVLQGGAAEEGKNRLKEALAKVGMNGKH